MLSTLAGQWSEVPPLAAAPGFSFADPYAIALAFAGVAVFAAIGALSHQHERAFSASLIYLGLGLVAATGIDLLGVGWIDPFSDARVIERLAEFALIVALFTTGLKLERALDPRPGKLLLRLLGIVMPLTIAAVTLFGTAVMGLSLGAAIILGATLAPTDPVLGADVGVGPPGEADEHDAHVALTAEGGLNDGLAFPFVFLGAFVATQGGTGWLAEWAVADVLFGIVVGVGIGAAAGYLIAASIVGLRDRDLLAAALDGWVAVGAVLLVYGIAEVAGAYGFLAAFAAGLAFRRYEHGHELNRRVHDGAELVEKFSELALILLLGSLVTIGGISEAGLAGWLLVPVLLLVIRPLATAIAFLGSGVPPGDRIFIGWFGIRGIGSLYYVAVALGLGILSSDEAQTLFWTVTACIVVSIVVHGVTATPLSRRLLSR
ncbi:MAG TPA: cation:proton antiporter [Solirubrobacteraceae bacterium]|nr:cation:proton antiporter [Solirubrobacteraceae bacterium]